MDEDEAFDGPTLPRPRADEGTSLANRGGGGTAYKGKNISTIFAFVLTQIVKDTRYNTIKNLAMFYHIKHYSEAI